MKPESGCSAFNQKAKRIRSHQRTPYCDDGGGGDDLVVCVANHTNDAASSPSLDILTGDYGQDGGNSMMCSPAAVEETVAAGPLRTEEERCGGWMERRNTSRGQNGEGAKGEARNSDAQKTRTSATAEEKEGGTRTSGTLVVGNQSSPKRLLSSEGSGDARRSCDAVLPLALPGEAHNMSFGAAAKAVVLVSGSSRLMVSRCSALQTFCWQPSYGFLLFLFSEI